MLEALLIKAFRGFWWAGVCLVSSLVLGAGGALASHPEGKDLFKAIDQAEPEKVAEAVHSLNDQMGQPTHEGNSLWDHAESRAMDAFKLLMEDGVMVSMDEIPEEIAAWNASFDKAMRVYEKLLNTVFDPEIKTRYQMRLFKLAIQEGPEESISLLLKQGYPVEARDERGATPLLFAIDAGKWRMVRQLLKEGADPNASSMVITPLMQAIQGGDTKSARLLLEQGAKVDAQLFKGETALWYAVRDSNEKAILLLLEFKANLNARTRFGDTPLMTAAETGKPELIRLLLEKGADPNHVDETGQTALMLASGAGNLAAVQALLTAGADVNAATSNGETALIRAVQRTGNIKVIQLLLENGADPDATSAGGMSPRLGSKTLGDSAYLKLFPN